jgi:hypothetical protein
MKKLAIVALLGLGTLAGAQAIRVDVPILINGPNVPASGGPLPQALLLANSTINLCQHPATQSSCVPIVTYTDITASQTCASTTPLVQLPGTLCTASTGAAAKIGFWYLGGTVDYLINSTYGIFGPYTITAPTPCGGTCSVNILEVADSPWEDVRAWGAKCDGVTNDSAAFLNAATASCSTNATILVPGACVANLVVPCQTFNVLGLNTTFALRSDNKFPSILIDGSAGTEPILTFNGTTVGGGNGGGVHGVAFEGAGAVGTNGKGVYVTGPYTRVTLDTVTFNNFGEQCIHNDTAGANPFYVMNFSAQNCVMNRTQASMIGALESESADTTFINSKDVTASVVSGSTYPSPLYNNPPTICAIYLNGHSADVTDIVGEESELGICTGSGSREVRCTNCRADLNAAHGFYINGDSSEANHQFTNSEALNNSRASANTYNDWQVINGKSNVFTNVVGTENKTNQALYCFSDTSTPDINGHNQWIGASCSSIGALSNTVIPWNPGSYEDQSQQGTGMFADTPGGNSVGFGTFGAFGAAPWTVNFYQFLGSFSNYSRLTFNFASGWAQISPSYLGTGPNNGLRLGTPAGWTVSIANNGTPTFTDIPSGNTITAGGGGWEFTGPLINTGSIISNVTGAAAYHFLNDVSGGNGAENLFQSAGATKWVEGSNSAATPHFVIYNAATSHNVFSADGAGNSFLGETSSSVNSINGVLKPATVFSAAGTALPTCNSTNVLDMATVSDAPAGSLTPGTAYASGGGSIKVWEQCAYSGSAYTWQSM